MGALEAMDYLLFEGLLWLSLSGGHMLTNAWQHKTKRWGHPFHAMCSYLGMFPARIPHYFIEKFTEPGDCVLDPFSGRGTTALQACVDGRVGIGIDANPLAYALTCAKVNPPEPAVLRSRIDDLSNDMFFAPIEKEPRQIRMLFHPHTLSQLVFLKHTLDEDDPTDGFIRAVLLGMLHGGARGAANKTARRKSKNPPSFLSIPMPNTFSMSPNYIEKYIREKKLEQPNLDVFASLRYRIDKLSRKGFPPGVGRAHRAFVQDIAALADPDIKRKRIKLIVSSPPYLKVLKYGLYNWIRLWFLDESPDELDAVLDQHTKLPDYLEFMNDTCRRLYRVLEPGGVCVLVIGDVKRGKQAPILLAEEVWKYLKKKRTKFRLADIIEDAVPDNKKVTKIWGEKMRGQATPVDRVLVMYKGDYQELREDVCWE